MNTVTVSTVEELRAACADPAVDVIRCNPESPFVLDVPIVAHSGLTIDMAGAVTIRQLVSPEPGTYKVPDDAVCACGHLISAHDGWIKGIGSLYCLAYPCRCRGFEEPHP